MRLAIPLFLVLLLPVQAAAQAAPPPGQPVEKVTVEAPKIPPEQGIHDFIKHSAQPTIFLGKIVRWRQPICPQTQGFLEPISAAITQRVRDIAAKSGAPVDPNPHCKANVLIYFTHEPQALLDQLVKRNEDMLGYRDVSQTQALATVTHPVQAWYATATRDADGRLSLDVSENPFTQECGRELTMEFRKNPGLAISMLKRCSFATDVSRGSLRDGMRSEMGRVTIIADSSKLEAYDADTLADYVTMLALSQVKAFEGCQDLPTISNLLAPDCRADRITHSLTETDLAYLRALYHIDPTLSLQLQRIAIEHEMLDAFKRQ